MERKYAPRSVFAKDMTYGFTNDIGLAFQYRELREMQPFSVWGMSRLAGKKDAFDDVSELLIAQRGRLCVGGARLSVSAPSKPVMLPMESNGLRLQNLFPELDLHETTYAEFSRFAALADDEAEVMPELSRLLLERAVGLGAEYAFILMAAAEAANYCEIIKQAGFSCMTRTNMEMHDEMTLCVVDLVKQMHEQTKAKRQVAEQ